MSKPTPVITLAQMYTAVQQLQAQVAELSRKLDNVQASVLNSAKITKAKHGH